MLISKKKRKKRKSGEGQDILSSFQKRERSSSEGHPGAGSGGAGTGISRVPPALTLYLQFFNLLLQLQTVNLFVVNLGLQLTDFKLLPAERHVWVFKTTGRETHEPFKALKPRGETQSATSSVSPPLAACRFPDPPGIPGTSSGLLPASSWLAPGQPAVSSPALSSPQAGETRAQVGDAAGRWVRLPARAVSLPPTGGTAHLWLQGGASCPPTPPRFPPPAKAGSLKGLQLPRAAKAHLACPQPCSQWEHGAWRCTCLSRPDPEGLLRVSTAPAVCMKA